MDVDLITLLATFATIRCSNSIAIAIHMIDFNGAMGCTSRTHIINTKKRTSDANIFDTCNLLSQYLCNLTILH